MQTANPTFIELLASVVHEPGRIHEAYTRFHNYSLGNQLLAMFQCAARGIAPGPMATYKAWQSLGRQVRKGSKALVLCQPVTVKRTETDEATGETTQTAFTRFTYRPKWFVLEQTEGEAYAAPTPPTWNQAAALEALDITTIPFDGDGNCQGFARGREVAVSPIAAAPFKTLAHEVAHVVLGHTDGGVTVLDGEELRRDLREVEAESVALLVAGSLELDGLEYSRGYIQHWMKVGGHEAIPEKNAQRIFKAADTILRAGQAAPEQAAA